MTKRLDTWPGKELIQHYRRVFSSNHGLEVLTHIMHETGVFYETADTHEEVALKRYGTRLLNILAGGEAKDDSIKEFAKRLMRQPLPKEHNPDE